MDTDSGTEPALNICIFACLLLVSIMHLEQPALCLLFGTRGSVVWAVAERVLNTLTVPTWCHFHLNLFPGTLCAGRSAFFISINGSKSRNTVQCGTQFCMLSTTLSYQTRGSHRCWGVMIPPPASPYPYPYPTCIQTRPLHFNHCLWPRSSPSD